MEIEKFTSPEDVIHSQFYFQLVKTHKMTELYYRQLEKATIEGASFSSILQTYNRLNPALLASWAEVFASFIPVEKTFGEAKVLMVGMAGNIKELQAFSFEGQDEIDAIASILVMLNVILLGFERIQRNFETNCALHGFNFTHFLR